VPIEAGMISNSVRRAQEQVESRNFQIRKRILEYDDVLNKQREVIYAIRRDILMGEDVDTMSYVEEVLTEVVSQYVSGDVYPEEWDLETLAAEINRFYPTTVDFKALDVENLSSEEVLELVIADARERLEERRAEWEERTAEMDRRGLARTDGVASFEEAERRTLLSVVDSRWREHLYEMDYLREGIGWRGLSQGPARRVQARGLRHIPGDGAGPQGGLRYLHLSHRERHAARGGDAGALLQRWGRGAEPAAKEPQELGGQDRAQRPLSVR
jgi:preprotein translocase subunit SecA